MRALRSRTNENSSSTSNFIEESINEENLIVNKKRLKINKSRKPRTNISEASGAEHRNYSLLKNISLPNKSVTMDKKGRSEDNSYKSTDSQNSVDDHARKNRSVRRKTRKTKQSLNEDLCLTFENAITSTIMKPRKHRKLLSVSSVNQKSAAVSTEANDSSASKIKTDSSSEMNALPKKHSRRQKRGKRKQKKNQSNDQHITSEGTMMETENEHLYVRPRKQSITNRSIVDNTTFEADKDTDIVQENKSGTNISDVEDRDSDIIFTKVINSTFDQVNFKEQNSNVDSMTKNNSTFDPEISPISNKQNMSMKSFSVIPKILINETFDNKINKSISNTPVLKSPNVGNKSTKIINNTFEVENLNNSKYPNISVIYNNSNKSVPDINNGTFDISNSSLKQNKSRRSNSFVIASNECSTKIDSITLENRKSSKSIQNFSVLDNQSNYIEDTNYNNERKSSTNKSLLSFENQSSKNDYLALDDISDVVLDEIINISDDSYMNSTRNSFDISPSSQAFVKSTSNIVTSDSFEEPVYNKSGEWKVQDITKSINAEISINKSSFVGNIESKSAPNLTMQHNVCFPKNAIQTETINLLTPNYNSPRKRWQKFAVNSPGANGILEQIGSPILRKALFSSRKTFGGNTPCVANNSTLKRCSSIKSNSKLLSQKPITANKSKFLVVRPTKSNTKINITRNSETKPNNSTKRIVMPNFAQIHQKAFEKMESLQEYSDRKKQRAKILLSTDKPQNVNVSSKMSVSKFTHQKENVNQIKSSRQLFKDNVAAGHNRFGFISKEIPVKKQPQLVTHKLEKNFTTCLPVRQVIKPKIITTHAANKKEKAPIFGRKDIIALGNKNKVENVAENRDNRRQVLKGVRTNRRFDLLMKMRNN